MDDINYPNDEAIRLHKCIETIWTALIPDQEIDVFGEMLQLSIGVTRAVIYQQTIDSQGTAILEYIERIEDLESRLADNDQKWLSERVDALGLVIKKHETTIHDLDAQLAAFEEQTVPQKIQELEAEVAALQRTIDGLSGINNALRLDPLQPKVDRLEALHKNQAETIERKNDHISELENKLHIANCEVADLEALINAKTQPEETPNADEE